MERNIDYRYLNSVTLGRVLRDIVSEDMTPVTVIYADEFAEFSANNPEFNSCNKDMLD